MTNGQVHRIEIIAGNQQNIKSFFTQVFGATFTAGEGGYERMSIGGTEIGGLTLGNEAPSDCIPFFKVSNIDASLALAENNGAWARSGPHNHPYCDKYATFRIPEGAVIGIYTV